MFFVMGKIWVTYSQFVLFAKCRHQFAISIDCIFLVFLLNFFVSYSDIRVSLNNNPFLLRCFVQFNLQSFIDVKDIFFSFVYVRCVYRYNVYWMVKQFVIFTILSWMYFVFSTFCLSFWYISIPNPDVAVTSFAYSRVY